MDVISALKNPDKVLFDEDTGKFIVVKKINDKILVVAYMIAGNVVRVVSAFITSKLDIVDKRIRKGRWRNNMKVEYDPESDILYIRIKEEQVKETVDLDDDIFADLNEKGEIVGIEIWQARKYIFSELLKFLDTAKKVLTS
ncbi:DUF2283 domain-containing protein [Archaeoglobus sp.]